MTKYNFDEDDVRARLVAIPSGEVLRAVTAQLIPGSGFHVELVEEGSGAKRSFCFYKSGGTKYPELLAYLLELEEQMKEPDSEEEAGLRVFLLTRHMEYDTQNAVIQARDKAAARLVAEEMIAKEKAKGKAIKIWQDSPAPRGERPPVGDGWEICGGWPDWLTLQDITGHQVTKTYGSDG